MSRKKKVSPLPGNSASPPPDTWGHAKQHEWQIIIGSTVWIFYDQAKAQEFFESQRLPWPGQEGGTSRVDVRHVIRDYTPGEIRVMYKPSFDLGVDDK